MSVRLDDARDVRDEDRLDAAKLDAYLKPRIAGLSGEPRIRQFHGGASNLTYLIGYGDRELVLRRRRRARRRAPRTTCCAKRR